MFNYYTSNYNTDTIKAATEAFYEKLLGLENFVLNGGKLTSRQLFDISVNTLGMIGCAIDTDGSGSFMGNMIGVPDLVELSSIEGEKSGELIVVAETSNNNAVLLSKNSVSSLQNVNSEEYRRIVGKALPGVHISHEWLTGPAYESTSYVIRPINYPKTYKTMVLPTGTSTSTDKTLAFGLAMTRLCLQLLDLRAAYSGDYYLPEDTEEVIAYWKGIAPSYNETLIDIITAMTSRNEIIDDIWSPKNQTRGNPWKK